MTTGRRATALWAFLAMAVACLVASGAWALQAEAPIKGGDKSEVDAAEVSLIAEGEANRAVAEAEAESPGPPPFTPDPWPEGIFKDDPFDANTAYAIENIWRHIEKDAYVSVWAGSYKEDPDKGVVFVYRLDPATGETALDGPIPVPIRGPVSIVKEDGDSIVLQGPDGSVSFATATETFSVV